MVALRLWWRWPARFLLRSGLRGPGDDPRAGLPAWNPHPSRLAGRGVDGLGCVVGFGTVVGRCRGRVADERASPADGYCCWEGESMTRTLRKALHMADGDSIVTAYAQPPTYYTKHFKKCRVQVEARIMPRHRNKIFLSECLCGDHQAEHYNYEGVCLFRKWGCQCRKFKPIGGIVFSRGPGKRWRFVHVLRRDTSTTGSQSPRSGRRGLWTGGAQGAPGGPRR